MVGFAAPEWLLLAPLAIAVGWRSAVRRRPALTYPDLAAVDGLPRGRAGRSRWARAGARGLAVLAAALAAANPRTPDHKTRVPAAGVAVVLVLDVSGSMAAPGFGGAAGSRLDAARAAFRGFAAGRPDDRLGLVTFAAVPRTACPLTLDHAALLAVLAEQQPADGTDAGTNVGDALAEGLIRADAAGPGRKVLVLLSDGEHNAPGPDPLAPRTAARLAADLGVPVYAVDCGGDPPADARPEQVGQREAGRRTLRAVADAAGGRYLPAPDPAGVAAALADVDRLERAPVSPPRYRRYHEYGGWCGAAAAGLAAAGWGLSATRWRAVP